MHLHALGILTVAFLCAAPMAAADEQNDWTEIRSGRRGVRSEHVHSDVVLRFQFQLVEPNTDSVVFIRARFGGPLERTDVGYRVHLSTRSDGAEAFGAVTGLNRTIATERSPTPGPSPRPGEWHDCLIRAVRDTLEVRIDDRLVTTVRDLTEWVGYYGFESKQGLLRVRHVEAEPLPLAGDPFGQGAVASPAVTDNPRLLKEVHPVYFESAFAARVTGAVQMDVVIESDGRVGDVRVTKPLHPDLDQAALAAVRQWRFSPATQAGKPVPTVVKVEMNFRR